MRKKQNNPTQSSTLLRLAVGFVYFYFGFLKFFPDLSPAELLASQTIVRMSSGLLDASTALWWLGVMECTIGLAFLFNCGLQYVFFLFLAHMAGTFAPLFILPELTFKIAPFAPTTEGQYIFKNVVFVAAGWTVLLPAVRAHWKRTLERIRFRTQHGPNVIAFASPSEAARLGRSSRQETRPPARPAAPIPDLVAHASATGLADH